MWMRFLPFGRSERGKLRGAPVALLLAVCAGLLLMTPTYAMQSRRVTEGQLQVLTATASATATSVVTGSVSVRMSRMPNNCRDIEFVGSFAASSAVGTVNAMRSQFGSRYSCSRPAPLEAEPWEDFEPERAYVGDGSAHFYSVALFVQYRDSLGNLSPVYCSELFGGCLPTPSSTPTPSPTITPTIALTPTPTPRDLYYAGAEGLSGAALRSALHEIIDDHTYYPYASSATDTQDIIREADEAPGNPGFVLTIYKNSLEPKNSEPTSWRHEQVWPRSYGFPRRRACNLADTDVHARFASKTEYDRSRGNLIFGPCLIPARCEPLAVDGHPDTPNLRGQDVWEVWPGRRGDVARAMLYMDVRYEGGEHSFTECDEPDLVLTDDRAQIRTSSLNARLAYMGELSTLLRWHLEDPVDAKERRRNDVVQRYQGNRNPFIDHPEWVCGVFGGACPPIYLPYGARQGGS